jgi:hypothetical protein
VKEELSVLLDKLTKQEVKLNVYTLIKKKGIDDLIVNLKDKYDVIATVIYLIKKKRILMGLIINLVK